MATGDQADIIARLRSYLPRNWFGDWTGAPVINGVLSGIASVFASVYRQIQSVRAQTRLPTSTGGWVDMWAADFFINTLPRGAGESDSAYANRILLAIFQKKVTRPAMSAALSQLTGNTPVIFEPPRPLDSGCFGSAYFGVARFGSIACPFSSLITIKRPQITGAAAGGAFFNAVSVSALHSNSSNGYFASLAAEMTIASDAQIIATINATRPIATNIGVSITS